MKQSRTKHCEHQKFSRKLKTSVSIAYTNPEEWFPLDFTQTSLLHKSEKIRNNIMTFKENKWNKQQKAFPNGFSTCLNTVRWKYEIKYIVRNWTVSEQWGSTFHLRVLEDCVLSDMAKSCPSSYERQRNIKRWIAGGPSPCRIIFSLLNIGMNFREIQEICASFPSINLCLIFVSLENFLIETSCLGFHDFTFVLLILPWYHSPPFLFILLAPFSSSVP